MNGQFTNITCTWRQASVHGMLRDYTERKVSSVECIISDTGRVKCCTDTVELYVIILDMLRKRITLQCCT
jgi:hypothetical protein